MWEVRGMPEHDILFLDAFSIVVFQIPHGPECPPPVPSSAALLPCASLGVQYEPAWPLLE